MPSSNAVVECARCSQCIYNQCSHCLVPYCYQCLVRHHHDDVRNEFMELIVRIDEILKQFLHHAHNQTEWTRHLTEDRARLEIYVRHIETTYPQFPVLTLPNCQWINHVHSLICKSSFSIYEDCCKLMYPLRDFSV